MSKKKPKENTNSFPILSYTEKLNTFIAHNLNAGIGRVINPRNGKYPPALCMCSATILP
jgi:hypothetical protein